LDALAPYPAGQRVSARRAAAPSLHNVIPGLSADGLPHPPPPPPLVPAPTPPPRLALTEGDAHLVVDADSWRSIDVVPREEWGADESIRFKRDGVESWPQMFVPVRSIVVHHTASPNYYDPESVPAQLRGILYYHTITQG